jgi:hypothetical protein
VPRDIHSELYEGVSNKKSYYYAPLDVDFLNFQFPIAGSPPICEFDHKMLAMLFAYVIERRGRKINSQQGIEPCFSGMWSELMENVCKRNSLVGLRLATHLVKG